MKNGISYTKEFLNLFFKNLLLDETNELDSKNLIISVVQNDKNVMVNKENVMVKIDDRVLSLIMENKAETIEELASLLGKSTRTIARAIKKLKDEIRITRIGSDKTGHWEAL